MATKAEIRNRALRKLGVLEAGGTPTADEITDVEEAYDALYGYLESKDAVTWDSDESVPVEAETPMVRLLMAEIADEFGQEEGRYQRIIIEAYGPGGKHGIAGGALADLIEMAQGGYVSTVTEAEYY